MTSVPKSRSEIKRQAILEAAREAFHEDGVHQTSMDKLAARAKVSKRTVYNHFASKEALVMELLSCLWKSAVSEDVLLQLAPLPQQEQLANLLFQEIRVFSEPQYLDMAKVAFGHFLFRPEALQEQLATMNKKETALYFWLVEQENQGKLAIKDTEKALGQLHNLIKGGAFWPQVIGACQPLSAEEGFELARETAAMFISHYGKQ
ncbi:TetR/AcrR family transcriptional regulator [Shewanella submarina]|uniref:TetR/AcrR family transcriptional regulator n=1 Tax=Shewanella submarina TaxID=2016376 RepID=A0ABV7GDJ9_9GAMM|nr:TetR/AcrR family transcriptional regulator [Shewanella submarina]MCL1037989.1 TetR/AcrR family transcriptional regulator [Shewanella submarina]